MSLVVRISTAFLVLSLVASDDCVDIHTFRFPRSLAVTEARSAVCQYSKLAHAFISFRTDLDGDGVTKDCAEMDFVICEFDGWRSAVCIANKKRYEEIFEKSGCKAVLRQIENEYQFRTCVLGKLNNQFHVTEIMHEVLVRVSTQLIKKHSSFRHILNEALWIDPIFDTDDEIVKRKVKGDTRLADFAAGVTDYLFSKGAHHVFNLQKEEDYFRTPFMYMMSKYATTKRDDKTEFLKKVSEGVSKLDPPVSLRYVSKIESIAHWDLVTDGNGQRVTQIALESLLDFIYSTGEDEDEAMLNFHKWATGPQSFVDELAKSSTAYRNFFGSLIFCLLRVSFPTFAFQCVSEDSATALKYLEAIRCMPTMVATVGYDSYLKKEPQVTGRHRCETFIMDRRAYDGVRDKKLLTHPAIIRRAVEQLLPFFQARKIDIYKGFRLFWKERFKNYLSLGGRLFWQEVPESCYGLEDEAVNCWVFTRCVRKLTNVLRKQLLENDAAYIAFQKAQRKAEAAKKKQQLAEPQASIGVVGADGVEERNEAESDVDETAETVSRSPSQPSLQWDYSDGVKLSLVGDDGQEYSAGEIDVDEDLDVTARYAQVDGSPYEDEDSVSEVEV